MIFVGYSYPYVIYKQDHLIFSSRGGLALMYIPCIAFSILSLIQCSTRMVHCMVIISQNQLIED